MLAEGLEVPVSFVGWGGTFKQDGLESEQGGREGMDNSHGDVAVLNMAIDVGDFFIELVSSIYQGGHKPIKAVVVGEFDTLIGTSGIELSSGTLGFVEGF